ncbi:hypothetical protein [Mesorhizobium sp. ZC-5]|uniref:hypothetical protein n=1 Tax=Mesorhizobium sp. ZC-5 TaxID=2986066 RepID=UPI0021E8A273|nr:hypothetical protein [Mesorhizobium sp. ZC-5]MCV3243290.1 hypothetical protein [Mesorhizobium sp. ZC-5]
MFVKVPARGAEDVDMRKRGNDYYLNRMKVEHPAVHAKYTAGNLSAREAIYKAGYQTKPTPLMILQREWRKASPHEQATFRAWIGGRAPPAPSTPTIAPVVSPDLRLMSWAKGRIKTIMASRNVKMGEVMDEMGLNPLDGSLGLAVRRDGRIKPDVALKLEKWLEVNRHI